MKNLWGLIVLSAVVSACSNHEETLISLREKRNGIVVEASEDQLAKIEKSFGIEAELLSENANLYLLRGVSQDEVNALGLNASTYPNMQVEAPVTPQVTSKNISQILQRLQNRQSDTSSKADDLSPTQPDSPKKPVVPSIQCNANNATTALSVISGLPTKPVLKNLNLNFDAEKSLSSQTFSLLRQTNSLVQATERKLTEIVDSALCQFNDKGKVATEGYCVLPTERNQVIKKLLISEIRKAIRNGALETPKENLKSIWIVENSLGQAELIESSTLNFRPNRVGIYQVYLLIQDVNSGSCDIDIGAVYVTDNPRLSAEPTSRSTLKPGAENLVLQLRKTQNIEARETSSGQGTVIAIIDTGVNYNHPSLRPNIFINKNEIPGNNVDDDGNGLVDDVYGYDFSNDDPYPFDDNRHGTHVAGIAAATDIGMAPDAKILPIKALPADTASIIRAMDYAVKMKADIVNMSLRGYANDQLEALQLVYNNPYDKVIAKGKDKSLFVLGAGNETVNNDLVFIWPANSKEENAITIAAVDENDALTPYSNYGIKEVDFASYGGTISEPILGPNLHDDISTFIGLSGTSMATPVVAGVAAQIKALLPNARPADLIEVLKASSIKNENLKDKIKHGAHIHSLNAVKAAKQFEPNTMIQLD